MSGVKDMRPIPIEAAQAIAKEYGYDQVVIMARRCHDTPEPHGEHITTYGRNKEHCAVAAMMGDKLKNVAGWKEVDATSKRIAHMENRIAELQAVIPVNKPGMSKLNIVKDN